MIIRIQYCVDGTDNVIRIQYELKTYLSSICNSWSVFREGGTKFVPPVGYILSTFHRPSQLGIP